MSCCTHSCLFARIALCAVLGFLPGCGGKTIYPVNGKVVYSDDTLAKELAGYKLEFEAIDTKLDGAGVSAAGEVQKDGTFQLTTRTENDGAVVGRHRVLIAPPLPEGDVPAGRRIIDPRYGDYSTSGLEATIEPKTNTVTLKVNRFKK